MCAAKDRSGSRAVIGQLGIPLSFQIDPHTNAIELILPDRAVSTPTNPRHAGEASTYSMKFDFNNSTTSPARPPSTAFTE